MAIHIILSNIAIFFMDTWIKLMLQINDELVQELKYYLQVGPC